MDRIEKIADAAMKLIEGVSNITDRMDKRRGDVAGLAGSGTTSHIATITAYPNKFGTFSGVVRDELTREITRQQFPTFDDARNWVKGEAWKKFGPITYASMPRKGEYLANCWKRN